MKLLINTGSMNSILNPSFAEKYYVDEIFQGTTHMKCGIGEITVSYKSAVDAISKFDVNYEISFILFQYNHLDDLISLIDIRNMICPLILLETLFNKFTDKKLNRQKHDILINTCE